MSRNRFIIISRSPTVADQNVITAFLKGKGWGFWHWMNNCWLVTTREDLTVKEISEQIRQLVTNMQYLVLEIKDEKRAGIGPKMWWEWFKTNWN